MLLQPDSRLYIMPAEGGTPRLMTCNTGRMNSWHTWSPDSRWLVFASKRNSPYTRLFITHVDTEGNDAPPVQLEHLTSPDRAANIPEFVNADPEGIGKIHERFVDDVSLWRAGRIFEDAGDRDNAFGMFMKALEFNEANVKAHVSAGNILESRGKNDKALRHYLRAVQLDSSFAIARINLGNIYLNSGKPFEAIEQYGIALHLAPDNGYAEYNFAQASFNPDRYPEALEHFQAARRLMHDDATTCFAIGLTLTKLGRHEEAARRRQSSFTMTRDRFLRPALCYLSADAPRGEMT